MRALFSFWLSHSKVNKTSFPPSLPRSAWNLGFFFGNSGQEWQGLFCPMVSGTCCWRSRLFLKLCCSGSGIPGKFLLLECLVLGLFQEFLPQRLVLVFFVGVCPDRNFLPQKLGWGRVLGIFPWIPRLVWMLCSGQGWS